MQHSWPTPRHLRPHHAARGHHPGIYRPVPGSCWATPSREPQGPPSPASSCTEGETEAQGRDMCVRGHGVGPPCPSRDGQAPADPGNFRTIKYILTHSHDAPKPAACKSLWEVLDELAHEGES